MFVFCYTLALHLLIMGVLARWSHRHTNDLAAIELLCAKQVGLHRLSRCHALFGSACSASRELCMLCLECILTGTLHIQHATDATRAHYLLS